MKRLCKIWAHEELDEIIITTRFPFCKPEMDIDIKYFTQNAIDIIMKNKGKGYTLLKNSGFICIGYFYEDFKNRIK